MSEPASLALILDILWITERIIIILGDRNIENYQTNTTQLTFTRMIVPVHATTDWEGFTLTSAHSINIFGGLHSTIKNISFIITWLCLNTNLLEIVHKDTKKYVDFQRNSTYILYAIKFL